MEWDRYPWWAQQVLQDGLAAEQPWIYRAQWIKKADNPFGPDAFPDMLMPDGPSRTAPKGAAPLSALKGEGMNVRRVTRKPTADDD